MKCRIKCQSKTFIKTNEKVVKDGNKIFRFGVALHNNWDGNCNFCSKM